MRVAVDSLDVPVADDVLEAVDREVTERVASSASAFRGARDIRLRLRQVKGALLCVAAVGFSGGGLITSTATSSSPLGAIVGALEGLPSRIDRAQRSEARSSRSPMTKHAAVREELKRLLESGRQA